MAVATRQQMNYIRKRARQLGLDPAAVDAVGRGEGYSGKIGDGGHAFGPGQMNNAGGVLTGKFQGMSPQQINQWAWSKQGIDHWLQGMAGVAKGLQGKQAVRAIITQYERPADTAGSVANALARYDGSGSMGGGGGGGKMLTRFDSKTYKKQAVQVLMEAASRHAAGDMSAGEGLAQSMQMLREANTNAVPGRGGGGGKLLPGGSSRVVDIAAKQLGQPYVWGGESRAEGGFDCSGLIQWAYGKAGIKLPRTAAEQGRVGSAVSYNKMRAGDLLVAKDGSHVVMYAGNGRVIAAPHRGAKVQWQSLSSFPSSTYKARRVRR